MTKEEQRRIFSRNLNHYVNISGHQQTEIAKAIGENLSTFNMWIRGKSMPSVVKIQKLADYFGIGKSDLVDDKSTLSSDASYGEIAYFLGKTDPRFAKIVRDYFNKDSSSKKTLCDFYERFIMSSEG